MAICKFSLHSANTLNVDLHILASTLKCQLRIPNHRYHRITTIIPVSKISLTSRTVITTFAKGNQKKGKPGKTFETKVYMQYSNIIFHNPQHAFPPVHRLSYWLYEQRKLLIKGPELSALTTWLFFFIFYFKFSKTLLIATLCWNFVHVHL